MAIGPSRPQRQPPTRARNSRPAKPTSPNLVPKPIRVTRASEGAPDIEDSFGTKLVARTLERARRQYRSICEGESILRQDMLQDRQFRLARIGKQYYQWPEGAAKDRIADGRPVLQVNRAGALVDMARNQGDGANLRIAVNPVGEDADPKVATVLAGMIRNVETQSFAVEDAYSTAGDGQCEMGRGYVWIITEYESDRSFRQRARLVRVLNPFRVKVDVSAQEKDQSDAEFAFYDTDLDGDTWDLTYGDNGRKVRPSPENCDLGDQGDHSGDWFPSLEKIRVSHWFCAEYEPTTLYQLKTPLPSGEETCFEKELVAEVQRLMTVALGKGHRSGDPNDPQAVSRAVKAFKASQVLQSRPVRLRKMMWRVIDAKYIHETSEWPTPWQPFVPMVGDESDLDGFRDVRGVVRDLTDSQRVYNVMVSSAAEEVNDAPKMPFIGWRGQFGKPDTDQLRAWKNYPRQKLAFLEADRTDIEGRHPEQLPQRNMSAINLQAYGALIQQADNDMKATARIHDATLSEGPVDRSGRALQERKMQDQIANSHLLMNRRRCLASCGRQLIRIFRVIYDVATVVRIVGADDRKQKVMIYNGQENDPRAPQNVKRDPRTGQPIPFELPEGVEEVFDIGTGEFDVEVTAAPKPGTQRQEDLSIASDMLKVMPPQYAVNFLDLFFKLIDTATGRAMSERAEKMLRPDLRDQSDKEGKPVPPELQQQMFQMQQRERMLMQALQKAEDTIRTKRLERASHEQVEGLKRFVELVKVMVLEENTDRRLMLKTETDRIHAFLEQVAGRISEAEADARQREMADDDRAFQADQQDRAAQLAGQAAASEG